MVTAMSKQIPDYALDAPALIWVLFGLGSVAIAIGLVMSPHAGLAAVASYAVLVFGVLCLILATLMFASSRFGKLRARDHLLDRLKLRGDETVLDVGCGHGLLLVAAAKLVPKGRAVGIDIWSRRDQSGNSPEATLKNAALEGVADRVSVRDGDMRKMPFPDRSFDAAVAHFAIHNVPTLAGRRETIREIVRTLNPGGQVAISDLLSIDLYADELRKSEMIDVEISGRSFWTFPPARTVTARKPSQRL